MIFENELPKINETSLRILPKRKIRRDIENLSRIELQAYRDNITYFKNYPKIDKNSLIEITVLYEYEVDGNPVTTMGIFINLRGKEIYDTLMNLTQNTLIMWNIYSIRNITSYFKASDIERMLDRIEDLKISKLSVNDYLLKVCSIEQKKLYDIIQRRLSRYKIEYEEKYKEKKQRLDISFRDKIRTNYGIILKRGYDLCKSGKCEDINQYIKDNKL